MSLSHDQKNVLSAWLDIGNRAAIVNNPKDAIEAFGNIILGNQEFQTIKVTFMLALRKLSRSDNEIEIIKKMLFAYANLLAIPGFQQLEKPEKLNAIKKQFTIFDAITSQAKLQSLEDGNIKRLVDLIKVQANELGILNSKRQLTLKSEDIEKIADFLLKNKQYSLAEGCYKQLLNNESYENKQYANTQLTNIHEETSPLTREFNVNPEQDMSADFIALDEDDSSNSEKEGNDSKGFQLFKRKKNTQEQELQTFNKKKTGPE